MDWPHSVRTDKRYHDVLNRYTEDWPEHIYTFMNDAGYRCVPVGPFGDNSYWRWWSS